MDEESVDRFREGCWESGLRWAWESVGEGSDRLVRELLDSQGGEGVDDNDDDDGARNCRSG